MRIRRTASLALGLVFSLWFSGARAEQPIASPAEITATVAPPAPAPADPNIDRGFIQPTAMTQPAGSVTYNNYELLLHGVTYGVTDQVQATLTVLPPITKDIPFVAFVAVKGRVSPDPRLHLALQGSAGYGQDFGSNSHDAVYTIGAGAYASVCVRQDCSSLLSASVNYQYATATGEASGTHLVVYGGSLVHRVGAHVKLLAELTSAAGGDGHGSLDNIDGFLASYGVRFFGGSFAGDVGFVKPIDTGSHDVNGDFVLGLPFVNVSYRWE
jgi:hypothetical protein